MRVCRWAGARGGGAALRVVVAALTTAALTAFAPVAAASSLPACRYDDVPTRHPWYSAWDLTLLDTILTLPASYAPADRVSTSEAGLNGGFTVRRLVIGDLQAMDRAARAAGARFAIYSAYRSYTTQARVFQDHVRAYGEAAALLASARPGHSEHQLGTTLDFRSYSTTRPPWDYYDWATTRPGAWLRDNAWRFGFVMSYPRGRTTVTCYKYEPWHYRYLGRDRARAIHESGLTTREWLWWKGRY